MNLLSPFCPLVDGHLGCFHLFWILGIMLLWTFVSKFLHEHSFAILLGAHVGVEFLDHMVTLWLTSWRIAATLLSKAVAYFTAPPAGCEGSGFSPCSPALVHVPCLHHSCPDGWSHTSRGLICIFPGTGDVEHLFMGLSTICVSSLEKCLFKFICPFLTWVAFLWSSCKSSLYFLGVSPLSDRWFVSILSHSMILSTCLMASSEAQRL